MIERLTRILKDLQYGLDYESETMLHHAALELKKVIDEMSIGAAKGEDTTKEKV